jgi:hypothetical protein
MVMSGLDCCILYFSSQEMEETMDKDEESCHVLENMIATSGMD